MCAQAHIHLHTCRVDTLCSLVPADQVDAVRDPEGAKAEMGIPGALTSAPEPQWEEDAQRILEILGLKGNR